MTPELWERLNPLFMEAVQRLPSERKAYIAAACGDDSVLLSGLTALVEEYELQSTATQQIDAVARRIVNSASETPLVEGDLVLGRFRIIRRLGSGSLGDVYEAFDSNLAHVVALKVIRSAIVGNETVLARFRKQVQLARRLFSPNIGRIYELFVFKESSGANNGAFMTMEFLDGQTLADALNQGLLPPGESEAIAFDICTALAAIHSAGLVTRDLKTRNIMLVPREGRRHAVLMDLGLARDLAHNRAVQPAPGLTVPGDSAETAEYCAPERSHAGTAITPATDLYALGIILYQLATGLHPFADQGAANPPGSAGGSVNRVAAHRWNSVIQKCLEFDPASRYQSASEVARALRLTSLSWAILRQFRRFRRNGRQDSCSRRQ